MSLLNQFPVALKRGRVIPGNDGYELGIEPGFKYQQKVHRFSITVKGRRAYYPFLQTLQVNYPNVKLGSNQYLLDVERVDVVSYLDPVYHGNGTTEKPGPFNTPSGIYLGDKDMRGIVNKKGFFMNIDGPWEVMNDGNITKTASFALPNQTVMTSFSGSDVPAGADGPYTGAAAADTTPKYWATNSKAFSFYTTYKDTTTVSHSGVLINTDSLSFSLVVSDDGTIFQDRIALPTNSLFSLEYGENTYNPASLILSDVTYNFIVYPALPYTDSML